MDVLAFHRYANLFPMMTDDEFKSLVQDIKSHGLREKIWLFEGSILDGRNRYQACLETGVMPQFREFSGTPEQALNAVLSWNLERRHLTASQKAVIGVDILPEFERLAKERQIASGRFDGKNPDGTPREKLQVPELIPEPEAGDRTQFEARTQAAHAVGVNERYVSDAKRLADSHPDLLSEVRIGNKTIPKAVKEAKVRDRQEQIQKISQVMQSPVQKKIEVQLGDIWQLGDHLLFCCDSSKWEVGGRFKMSFADPPYNGSVDHWDKDFQWQHDWLIDICDYVFVTPGIANHQEFLFRSSMQYRWTYIHWLCNAISQPNDWGMSNVIHALMFSELDSLRLEKHPDFRKATVDQSQNYATDHKGRKPASLLHWLVEMTTEPGDRIIDPFLGSGTTLLAAQQLGRVCYGAEISPEYCSEIIARWEKEFDGSAVKVA